MKEYIFINLGYTHTYIHIYTYSSVSSRWNVLYQRKGSYMKIPYGRQRVDTVDSHMSCTCTCTYVPYEIPVFPSDT